MKQPFKTGFSFGLASGIITTLGLIIGLYSSTNSQLVVLGGILTIAIADALSDALGIHVSEESRNRSSTKEVWEASALTFASKFVFALTFVVPVILLPLSQAVVVGVAWGLFMLGIFSFYIGRNGKRSGFKAVVEHLFIAIIVILITYYLGLWIRATFV